LQSSISFNKAGNQLNGVFFSAAETLQIRGAIKKKYAGVANSAEGFFMYPVGKKGAELLGYDRQLLEELPEELLNAFCGVGNPLAIDRIKSGSRVLDIGCGAGFDLYVASCQVGSKGKVIGVDLTPEMVDRARRNLAATRGAKLANTEVLLVAAEQMPFADHTFDVVISNGVINLSPNKSTLFSEIYRILKPGGKLQFADVILEKNLPPHLAANVESWSQ
jgi:SAM-dependent methyltransferase